jgi:anti-sigma regulatory factor (Ser/Thr protein kinase)
VTEPARRTVARTFEPNAESPRLARRFVGDALDDLGARGAADSAVLLVSELVTNAVLHARTEVEVIVAPADESVRVSVVDRSPAMPAQRSFSATAGSGRGLHLVESVASRWGVASRDQGKEVWFEIDLDAEPAPVEFDLDSVPSL